jgi:hypothetical protein
MKDSPEINDLLQDLFFQNIISFSDIKELFDKLEEIVNEPGMNLLTIQGIVKNANIKIEELENEEPPRHTLEFINLQIKSIQNETNN